MPQRAENRAGSSGAAGAHRLLADAARDPIEVRPRFPEVLLNKGQAVRLEMAPGFVPNRYIFAAVANQSLRIN
jgi:hypothetical protein